ncbi:MAG: methionyl-tRNA formyltransferase [Pseudomonadota bacterium]
MKVVFAGTPEFAAVALESIAKHHEILAVFTQPDRRAGRGKKMLPSAVKECAQRLNKPIFQPLRISDDLAIIEALKADIMVVVAYGMILPPEILNAPRLGCLNIHASILPKWRGAAPIQRAIEAGDELAGVSIMQMEASLDTGPVFLTLTTPVSQLDTSGTLHDRLAQLGAEGIVDVLGDLSDDTGLRAESQDHALASYAHKLSKSEALVNWLESAEVIERRIRAFNPWPVCQTTMNGETIRLWQASLREASESDKVNAAAAGVVKSIDDDGIQVQCGSGVIQLNSLQKRGGKPLDAKSFRNGFAIDVGDRFGAS